MIDELLCPNCEEPLTEEKLKKSLTCPHCKTDLKQNQFREFLEFLVAQDIIDNVDFFDMSIYGEEILKEEPIIDSDETDPSEYEKKVIDTWDEFEDETESTSDLTVDDDDDSEWYPLDTDEIEDLDEDKNNKK